MNTLDESNTRKLQAVLLDILTAVHTVCKEHNLRYYLIAGTMLGAVRHKGFIPWDDDADIALPRKDYEIFIAHANKWLPSQYELVSGDKEAKFPYQFARIQDKRTTYILRRSFDYIGGVPLDIFPLDGMTSNPIKQYIHYFKYRIVEKIMYYNLVDPYKHGKDIRSMYIRLCHKLFSPACLHKTLDRIQKEYDYETSSLVADHDNSIRRGILPKEIYGTPSQISFEGKILNGVQQPAAYLTRCYGNYMEIPKLRPPINFRYLDLHTPYEQYIKTGKETARKG